MFGNIALGSTVQGRDYRTLCTVVIFVPPLLWGLQRWCHAGKIWVGRLRTGIRIKRFQKTRNYSRELITP